ncbi:general transcription repressor [Lithohypha guttulata]|uniref:General transcription repressor n=1 Tax=Lithohypha guttulata TaxID=1690604 RepID=A0AAN7T612_9EURO|nr:general transcription repressor [Lithohypha guttulata]KAK5090020.1 general transcription repressor [Lithohypha guttulata]KAK5099163.1 general transcription repressor [Lithohypha guttulata]
MFNATQHRGNLGPGQPAAHNGRLNEIFDQLRAEFENQSRGSEQMETQVSQQIQEMELIRNKVYQLEQNQLKMKQDYEAEIRMLRHELELRGGAPVQTHLGGPPQHGGPSQPQPPALGHGQGTLFSGIMANQGQGGPGLAPPPDQQPPPQQHPLAPPPSGGQPQGPAPPSSFAGYQPGPTLNGYASQPQPPTNSPGPSKRNIANRGPGPATPQQHPGQPQQMPYQADPRASPQIPRPTPPGNELQPSRGHQLQPQYQHQISNVTNNLADLPLEELPDTMKRIGQDWHAVFNPALPRILDVNLVHNLVHESVVCCVRFSGDGKYVATGCNRSAQIFDARDGKKVCELLDDSVVDKDGDLYIRSVCFSPDGKLLATGAEDRRIRVWDIETRKIKCQFDGHEQDIYSLDFARNGRLIASGSGDKTVRLWDIETRTQIMMLSIEDGVTTVAMSPNGQYVAAGSLDKSVRVWDCTSGYLIERLEGAAGHKDSVYSVAFSPTGRELVSGSLDKTIKMWELSPQRGLLPSNASSGKCIRTFDGHKDYVLSVCLTPDGQWVMSGSKDRGVQFWDPNTGNAQMMLQGHKNSVISVAPCPTGHLFATGSGDMKARIWQYGPYR